ncbi:LLM class flavin-dependent oxidoreductase [Salana multivorans]
MVSGLGPAVDVVLSPFGGDGRALLEAAVAAEDAGLDGVWTFDHISSLASIGAPGVGASRDPFVVLGAVAARTERVRVGTLVANLHNRLPEQLALAIDTLDSLAPGRVVCGVGAGAGVGSPFAREDAALGRVPEPAPVRRAMLAEYVQRLDETWAGSGVPGVVVGPRPPIIVGAGSTTTLRQAAVNPSVDGVNIVTGLSADLPEKLAVVRESAGARPFEVSVFLDGGAIGVDEVRPFVRELVVPGGVDRLTVLVRP